jgi:hypothetical protein
MCQAATRSICCCCFFCFFFFFLSQLLVLNISSSCTVIAACPITIHPTSQLQLTHTKPLGCLSHLLLLLLLVLVGR